MSVVPCLCTALTAEEDGENGENPANQRSHPDQFSWDPAMSLEARLENGQATHLNAMAAAGITTLLDCHTHWFPENVEKKIWSYFDRHYWKVTYRFPNNERLGWMRKNGVQHFTALNYAHRPNMASWLNDWTAEFTSTVPESIPCGTFYAEPTAGEDVRRCIEEYGFRGFKLHLRVSDMDPTHPLLEPAFEQVAHAGLPLIVHSGSAPEPGRYTSPGYIRALLERHPNLKVVVAHMGANEYEEYVTLAEEFENLYLDTTMVFVSFWGLHQYPKNLIQRLETLSHKVLFGSDFPTIPYPVTHAVESVLGLDLSQEAKKRILGENTARLFGVETNGATTAP